MQDNDLLTEGLALMGLGMGFVFVFLTILVITVTLMSIVIRRFQPVAVNSPTQNTPKASSAPVGQDDEVMAVISAAVHRYRRHKGL